MKSMPCETEVGVRDTINEDRRVMAIIRNICKQGRNAEVKQNKDGTFKVYDVTKHIAI